MAIRGQEQEMIMEKVNINREKNTENCIALIDYENCSNLTEIPLNIYTVTNGAIVVLPQPGWKKMDETFW